jgi:hypothetical protein
MGVAINKAIPISAMATGVPDSTWLVPAIGYDSVALLWRPYKVTIASLASSLITKVLSGSGPPSAGLGNNGDFYIDTSVVPYVFYGPKTGGAWGTGVASSNTVRNGTGAPGAGVGLNGDFYLDTATVPYTIYGPKASECMAGRRAAVDSGSERNGSPQRRPWQQRGLLHSHRHHTLHQLRSQGGGSLAGGCALVHQHAGG